MTAVCECCEVNPGEAVPTDDGQECAILCEECSAFLTISAWGSEPGDPT